MLDMSHTTHFSFFVQLILASNYLTNFPGVSDGLVHDESDVCGVVAVACGPVDHLEPLLSGGGDERATVGCVLHCVDVQYCPIGTEAGGDTYVHVSIIYVHTYNTQVIL